MNRGDAPRSAGCRTLSVDRASDFKSVLSPISVYGLLLSYSRNLSCASTSRVILRLALVCFIPSRNICGLNLTCYPYCSLPARVTFLCLTPFE